MVRVWIVRHADRSQNTKSPRVDFHIFSQDLHTPTSLSYICLWVWSYMDQPFKSTSTKLRSLFGSLLHRISIRQQYIPTKSCTSEMSNFFVLTSIRGSNPNIPTSHIDSWGIWFLVRSFPPLCMTFDPYFHVNRFNHNLHIGPEPKMVRNSNQQYPNFSHSSQIPLIQELIPTQTLGTLPVLFGILQASGPISTTTSSISAEK